VLAGLILKLTFNAAIVQNLIYNFYLLFIYFIKIIQYSFIFKNYKAELFILFEFLLIFVVWIIFFVIYPENNLNISCISISLRNFNINNILINKFGIRHFKSEDQFKKHYRNTWNSIYFNLDNQIFSIKLLEFFFENFWKIVSPKIFEDCHIFILLKFQFADNNFHNIGRLIRLDHNNYKSFIT
jgi:energy-coupling factor transporter transmembrane protein EcfT